MASESLYQFVSDSQLEASITNPELFDLIEFKRAVDYLPNFETVKLKVVFKLKNIEGSWYDQLKNIFKLLLTKLLWGYEYNIKYAIRVSSDHTTEAYFKNDLRKWMNDDQPIIDLANHYAFILPHGFLDRFTFEMNIYYE